MYRLKIYRTKQYIGIKYQLNFCALVDESWEDNDAIILTWTDKLAYVNNHRENINIVCNDGSVT